MISTNERSPLCLQSAKGTRGADREPSRTRVGKHSLRVAAIQYAGYILALETFRFDSRHAIKKQWRTVALEDHHQTASSLYHDGPAG